MKFTFILLSFFTFIIIDSSNLYAQRGCTDPNATNYDPSAKVNDGSCMYPETKINPTVTAEMGAEIPESSGLVYTNGKLWTHNDSGNPNTIFSIDTSNGKTLQTIYIDNFTNTDWEDITADSEYIYVSDCGNNNGDRNDLKILKIAKKDIGNGTTVHVNASAINISYADQTVFTSSSTHNFDCESVLSIGNFLYLFTKDRGDLQTRVYKVSKTPGTYSLTYYISFNANGLVCGADYDPVKKEVALVGYFKGHLNSFVWIFNEFVNDSFFNGNKRRLEIGDGTEWQTEGICYRSTGKLFISCESAGKYANSTLFSTEKSVWEKHLTSGINESIPRIAAIIYPNPSNNIIHIDIEEPVSHILIINQFGQTIYSKNASSKNVFINTDELNYSEGVFELIIESALGLNKYRLGLYH